MLAFGSIFSLPDCPNRQNTWTKTEKSSFDLDHLKNSLTPIYNFRISKEHVDNSLIVFSPINIQGQ